MALKSMGTRFHNSDAPAWIGSEQPIFVGSAVSRAVSLECRDCETGVLDSAPECSSVGWGFSVMGGRMERGRETEVMRISPQRSRRTQREKHSHQHLAQRAMQIGYPRSGRVRC